MQLSTDIYIQWTGKQNKRLCNVRTTKTRIRIVWMRTYCFPGNKKRHVWEVHTLLVNANTIFKFCLSLNFAFFLNPKMKWFCVSHWVSSIYIYLLVSYNICCVQVQGLRPPKAHFVGRWGQIGRLLLRPTNVSFLLPRFPTRSTMSHNALRSDRRFFFQLVMADKARKSSCVVNNAFVICIDMVFRYYSCQKSKELV